MTKKPATKLLCRFINKVLTEKNIIGERNNINQTA